LTDSRFLCAVAVRILPWRSPRQLSLWLHHAEPTPLVNEDSKSGSAMSQDYQPFRH
jgi:hypothetical protein